jgi:hypothetical protein
MNTTKRASALLILAVMFESGLAIAQSVSSPIKAPPKEIPAIEQNALEIVKKMSDTLARAKTMQFQARVQSEAPSLDGISVIYTSSSAFAVQRPNKMAVLRSGQGVPSELIYDGKSVVAITPHTDIVAHSKAPATIDEMAEFVYQKAGIYFPGGMILLSDPYSNITGDLRAAFVVGKTTLVGGVETDVVVLAGSGVEGQFWIGSQDKLPYMMTMIYTKEPNRPRVTVEYKDWKVNQPIDSDRFNTEKVANAIRVDFARPDVNQQ